MSDTWDWYEYEMIAQSGTVFMSHTVYVEPGHALDSAIDKAIHMKAVIERINIRLIEEIEDHFL